MTVTFDQITVNGRSYPIRGTVTQALEGEGVKGDLPNGAAPAWRDHRRHPGRLRAHGQAVRAGRRPIAGTEGKEPIADGGTGGVEARDRRAGKGEPLPRSIRAATRTHRQGRLCSAITSSHRLR